MSDRLKNKVALVLGAGSVGEGVGNGRAICVLFAREGAKLVGADVNLAAAEETANLVKPRSIPCFGNNLGFSQDGVLGNQFK